MIHLVKALSSRTSDRAFARRVAQWDRGEIELTEEESRRALASVDSDILAITRYLSDELSPADEAALELRLQADGQLRERFRVIHRTYVRIEEGHHDDALFGLDDEGRAIAEQRRGTWMGVATAVVLGLGMIAVLIAKLTDGVTMVRESVNDRASTAGLKAPITIEAAPADTTIGFALVDLVVRRGSRLTYPGIARSTGGTGVMALDGEAAFHSWGAAILLRTPTCVVHMLAGRYAVRSQPHSGVTVVTVDSGMAWIESSGRPDEGSKHEILAVVHAGEHVFMTRGRSVTVMAEFPVATFAPPVGTFENDSSANQLLARVTYERSLPAVNKFHAIRR